MIAEVAMWENNTAATGRYLHAYVGDTITFDRLTLNVGLRWDRSSSSVNELSQPGNPALPTLLPAVTGQPFDDVVTFNAVRPRVGMTYALDEARRTLLRAGYGAFVSQMNATEGGFLSTVQARGVYFYGVADTNGNKIVDASEIAGRTCTPTSTDCSWYGFDVSNPAQVDDPVDSVGDYTTPLTHEVQFGIDHELMPNFGISGTFTWRRFTNFNWRNNGLTGSEYVQIGSFDVNHPAVGSFSAPVYGVPDLSGSFDPTNKAADVYRQREGYSQRYLGFELSATKRLSNRWMARLGFSTNDHREYFDSLDAIGDPTPQIPFTSGLGYLNLGVGPSKDGGLVMRPTSGSGKSGIYQVLPRYQFILTGLYQAPYGVNLAMNMVTRQGFSTPYYWNQIDSRGSGFSQADANSPLKTALLVEDVGDERLSSVTSLDARIGKEFAFNRVRVNVDLDVFNVLNASTVLGRQYNLRVTSADDVLEIINPRVLRLGLRFNF
jgi:hypothetical protein